MYEFESIDRHSTSQSTPLEAVTFGGIGLDTIASFTTLNVKGRNTQSKSINSVDTSGDGSIFLSSKLEKRTIEVSFKWSSEDIEAYNRDFKLLNYYLKKDQVKIKFADDTNNYFVGTLSKLSIDGNGLETVGTIEIECSDPYKHSEAQTIRGNTNSFEIVRTDNLSEIIPLKLTITSGGAENILIKLFRDSQMTGEPLKKILLNQSVSQETNIEIDFKELTVKIGGGLSMMRLDLSSNLGDFYDDNGNFISINSCQSYEFQYEVRSL